MIRDGLNFEILTREILKNADFLQNIDLTLTSPQLHRSKISREIVFSVAYSQSLISLIQEICFTSDP